MRITLLTLTWTTLAGEDSFDSGATRKARLLGGWKQKARLTESGMALLFAGDWEDGRVISHMAQAGKGESQKRRVSRNRAGGSRKLSRL